MAPEGGAAAGWRAIALAPPRAGGTPAAAGTIRAESGDFQVDEDLGFEPDGGVSHRLLRIEKQNANTLFVAGQLAARAGCSPGDVGFAGMKDRRAIARQWFTVPARPGISFDGFSGDGFQVLAEHAHSRKLRRGALAGNRFLLRVRGLTGDRDGIEARIRQVVAAGFPNYFGPQRFGHDGANLERVLQWMDGARLPRGREGRAFILSSARALAFNAVLGARVRDGSWNRLLPGEVVNLLGSASVFAAPAVDPVLENRCRDGDVYPTGPLCGSGGLAPSGEAAAVEAAALEPLSAVAQRLAEAGMRGDRRALAVRPAAWHHEFRDGALECGFALPRGAFATSLLAELMDVRLPESGGE